MKKNLSIAVALIFLCYAVLYTGWWFTVAGILKSQMKSNPDILVTRVSGFPGPMVIEGSAATTRLWQNEPQKITVPTFTLRGFPVQFLDATLTIPQGVKVEGSIDPDLWSLDQLTLKGPIPLDFPQTLDEPTMTAWRDNGGHITVNHFSFVKGELKGEGAGTLKLDDKLQPSGLINARISGHIEYLNLLVQKGLVDRKDAMLASTILGGLSSPDEDTGVNHMDIGISLQNQTLYAGPLAVAQLPALYWGSDSQPALPQSPDDGLPASAQTYPEAPDHPHTGLPVAAQLDPQ